MKWLIHNPDLHLLDYHLFKALMLLALMTAYAFCLRPLGFLFSTSTFLMLGSFILGERKWWILIPISSATTFLVWYLVQEVLGIYMRPLPGFIGG